MLTKEQRNDPYWGAIPACLWGKLVYHEVVRHVDGFRLTTYRIIPAQLVTEQPKIERLDVREYDAGHEFSLRKDMATLGKGWQSSLAIRLQRTQNLRLVPEMLSRN